MHRVLIVDDSRMQARHVSAILAEEGFRTHIASSGDEALAVLGKLPVDLVVSDVVMPGMSGYELCRRLKTHPQWQRIPLILLTARNGIEDVINGLESGADGFLTKPADAQKLLGRVLALLFGANTGGGDSGDQTVRTIFLGRHIEVSASKRDVVNFLVSALEDIHQTNKELEASRNQLSAANASLKKEMALRERAEGFLRTSEKRLSLMMALSRRVAELSVTEICDRALDIAVEVTGSQVGYLHFINPDQESLQLVTWNQAARELCRVTHDQHYPLAEAGIWADSARQRWPVVHNDYPRTAGRKGVPTGHFPIQRHMSVPVVDGEAVLMVVGVGNKEQPYDDTDMRQLQLVADDINRLITRKRTEEALAQAKREADEANHAKSSFLARMSHEIRTPMNAVIGLTTLALKNKPSPRMRDYLTKIHAAGRSLLGIINDILDFSKIEAGELRMERVGFSLDDVLNQLTTVVVQRAEEKGLEFLLDVGPDIPRRLVGDPLRLGQVLINLANNAIKFTEQGVVKLKIRRGGEKDGGVTLQFEVKDTGIGLKPEQMERLFQSFSQADVSTTRNYGGSGLGLAICKRLVEMMGGGIGVESAWGEGSAFRFDARFGLEAEAGRVAEPPSNNPMQGLRTLVIDDSKPARKLMVAMLKQFGADPAAVGSGKQGLAALVEADLQERPYALVLVDWKMADMNGIEVVRQIKRGITLGCAPKVVLVTGYGNELLRQQAEQEQVDGLLLKPFSYSMMFDTLINLFNQPEERWEGALPEGHDESRDMEQACRGLRLLLVEDNEINQQVARELLQSVGVHVMTANNGQEAMDLLLAQPFPMPLDGVLMDLQMPVMDGYQATALIRAHSWGADLPIVGLTAHALNEERERCLKLGMNGYVTKPIEPDVLFGAISRCMRRGGGATAGADKGAGVMERQAPRPSAPEAAAGALPPLPGIELEQALARMAGNQRLYRDLARQFVARQADAAQRMEAAWRAGDGESAGQLAHTVKGVAANMGVVALQSAAARLEGLLRAGGDPAAMEPALAAFAERLAETVQLFSVFREDDPAAGGAEGELNVAQLRAELVRLHGLLSAGDGDADLRFHEIHHALQRHMPPDLLQGLSEHIANFDYEAACGVIGQQLAAFSQR